MIRHEIKTSDMLKNGLTEELPANFPPYILSPPLPANQLKVTPYKSGHTYRSHTNNLH
jgi:hypothetical protein